MDNIDLKFEKINYVLPFILVEGTKGTPFLFGSGKDSIEVTIRDYYISQFTITQKLYEYLVGFNPANNKGNDIPVECVSYNELIMENGFLEKINQAEIKGKIAGFFDSPSSVQFRLPSETEWEYAAKGGPNWTDSFVFSGSNSIDEVAWYKDNSFNQSWPVGRKKPNQLGIYDMSGNIWEWCLDHYHSDMDKIPRDGSPCLEESEERVLRGGCFHNWAVHCTSIKRYAIMPQFKDPCISFRLVLSFE